MLRPTAFLLAASLATAPALAEDPGTHATWFVLDHGNVDMTVTDGTQVTVAPGSEFGINHAEGAGETTHILLHHGHLSIDNSFHAFSDTLHIEADGNVFELERGHAVISHGPGGLHATLMHGRRLGLRGHPAAITTPGMRLGVEPGGPRLFQPDAGEVRDLMDRFGGPGGPGGPGGLPGGVPGLPKRGEVENGVRNAELSDTPAGQAALAAIAATPALRQRLRGGPPGARPPGNLLRQHGALESFIEEASILASPKPPIKFPPLPPIPLPRIPSPPPPIPIP